MIKLYLAFETDDKLTYSLGTQDSVKWQTTAGQDLPTLIYSSGERTSSVELKCMASGGRSTLEVYGYDIVSQMYKMTLSSKCACWNGCNGQK